MKCCSGCLVQSLSHIRDARTRSRKPVLSLFNHLFQEPKCGSYSVLLLSVGKRCTVSAVRCFKKSFWRDQPDGSGYEVCAWISHKLKTRPNCVDITSLLCRYPMPFVSKTSGSSELKSSSVSFSHQVGSQSSGRPQAPVHTP